MTLRSALTGAVLSFLLCAAPVAAQSAAYGRGGFEIGGFGGLLDVSTPDGVGFDVDQDWVAGGRLGYVFSGGFFILAEGAYSPQTMATSSGTIDLDVLRLGGQLGYAFQPAARIQILLSIGGGAFRWEPEGLASETDFAATAGAGLRVFIARALALRLDVRDHVVPDAFATTTRRVGLGSVPDDALTHNPEYSAGLSFFLGGSGDRDRDGVQDGRDACPDTPAGAFVDTSGCPLDSDGDRVADHLDHCRATPTGVVVDESGCPIDSDGDGVLDGLDGCSDTPAGAPVDAQGCPTDEDKDGVLDGLDECPGTPAGATVDARGCASDADEDGVPDGLDACPETPAGAEVDGEGCSRIEAGIEAGRLVLEDVHFDFGKAEIRPDSRTILNEVGRTLADRPELRVEIQGHTDAIGSEEANLAISRRRAEAVRAYLIETFPELDTTRLEARGYGPSRPIASNDTEEGRARNRRVEFVVVDGG